MKPATAGQQQDGRSADIEELSGGEQEVRLLLKQPITDG
jgi:hypothetical protein